METKVDLTKVIEILKQQGANKDVQIATLIVQIDTLAQENKLLKEELYLKEKE